MPIPPYRPQIDVLRWQDVDTLEYKADRSSPGGASFRDVTRRVLFSDSELGCELRYFEVSAGGYTTLERHEHAHAVVVERGRGRCLVGDRIYDIAAHDLVHVPALTWHQFRADDDQTLGFLCMVNATRDRPELPDTRALESLRRDPEVAAFLSDSSPPA